MHRIKIQLAGLLMCLMASSHAEDLTKAEQHAWIERDWEIRYLLFVGPEKDRAKDYREAEQMNARAARKGSTYPLAVHLHRVHGAAFGQQHPA
ncbi:hypothetical protein GTP55_00330 [Duganella sp. FT109W]|uniref:DUF4148 domain-containing protein n=1 Tax=Duganella margarita TaxID=2692170 RepID=A0ABW9WA26_9BURK|nr:hypothetical protein [Duganella margarita]MYN37813.1 hypothetical protein [Duganella margarita]